MLSFKIEPFSAHNYVGDQLVIEAVAPTRNKGQYKLVGFGSTLLSAQDAATLPDSLRLSADDIPSGGENYPNGTIISAFVAGPKGQLITQVSATVSSSPFLGGIFSR